MPNEPQPQLADKPTKVREGQFTILALLGVTTLLAIVFAIPSSFFDTPVGRVADKGMYALLTMMLILDHPRLASIGALVGMAIRLLVLAGNSPWYDSEWHWYDSVVPVMFAAMSGALIGAWLSSFKKSASADKAPDPSP
jgi:hypothetical protein